MPLLGRSLAVFLSIVACVLPATAQQQPVPPIGADPQPFIAEFDAGTVENKIVFAARNHADATVRGLTLRASQPLRWLTITTIEPEQADLGPGATAEFTVEFAIVPDAPDGAEEAITFFFEARDASPILDPQIQILAVISSDMSDLLAQLRALAVRARTLGDRHTALGADLATIESELGGEVAAVMSLSTDRLLSAFRDIADADDLSALAADLTVQVSAAAACEPNTAGQFASDLSRRLTATQIFVTQVTQFADRLAERQAALDDLAGAPNTLRDAQAARADIVAELIEIDDRAAGIAAQLAGAEPEALAQAIADITRSAQETADTSLDPHRRYDEASAHLADAEATLRFVRQDQVAAGLLAATQALEQAQTGLAQVSAADCDVDAAKSLFMIVEIAGSGFIPHYGPGSFRTVGKHQRAIEIPRDADPVAIVGEYYEQLRSAADGACKAELGDGLGPGGDPPIFWSAGPQVTIIDGPFIKRPGGLTRAWTETDDGNNPTFSALRRAFGCG